MTTKRCGARLRRRRAARSRHWPRSSAALWLKRSILSLSLSLSLSLADIIINNNMHATTQCLKSLSGKFTPIQQWLAFGCQDLLPSPLPFADSAAFQPKSQRFDALRVCIGTGTLLLLLLLLLFMCV
jgi:hypothetical protein